MTVNMELALLRSFWEGELFQLGNQAKAIEGRQKRVQQTIDALDKLAQMETLEQFEKEEP